MKFEGKKLNLLQKLKVAITAGVVIFNCIDDIEEIEIKALNGTGVIFEEDCSYSYVNYIQRGILKQQYTDDNID